MSDFIAENAQKFETQIKEQRKQFAQPQSAVSIMTTALTQVEEVLAKAESTYTLLQQNLQQVATQRIGLQSQKQMLMELITKVKQVEKQ